MSYELYIGNLDRNVNSDELRNIFQVYGNLTRSEVKMSDQTHNASYGFVAFESAADAELAKKQVNGIVLHSRRMIVQCSKTKPGDKRRRRHDRSIGLDRRESRYRSKSRSPRRRSTSQSRRKHHHHRRKRAYRSRSLSTDRTNRKRFRLSSKDNHRHSRRRRSSSHHKH